MCAKIRDEVVNIYKNTVITKTVCDIRVSMIIERESNLDISMTGTLVREISLA